MALVKTSYLFAASMDVEPDKEKLFNEVYDNIYAFLEGVSNNSLVQRLQLNFDAAFVQMDDPFNSPGRAGVAARRGRGAKDLFASSTSEIARG